MGEVSYLKLHLLILALVSHSPYFSFRILSKISLISIRDLRFCQLRAVCVRYGIYKEVNFNYDIGRRLLKGLLPAWNHFFKQLEKDILYLICNLIHFILFDAGLQILDLEEGYATAIADFHAQLDEVLKENGINNADNRCQKDFLRRILEKQVAKATSEMEMRRKQCFDLVEKHIEESMQYACILLLISYLSYKPLFNRFYH